MSSESSKKMVKKVLKETTRRRKKWIAMQQAANDAVDAVVEVAESRGITDLNLWFTRQEITFTYWHWMQRRDVRLNANGLIVLPFPSATDYEGLPKRSFCNPRRFKQEVIKVLMGLLNTYCRQAPHRLSNPQPGEQSNS